MLFGHGSDLYKYQREIVADFSSNVWYKGMPEQLVRHLENQIQKIVHYPEPDAGSLSEKLAQLHGVNAETVLVTNGATEAFYLLAQLYVGFDSYIVYPSFAEYEDACKTFNHKLHYIYNTTLDIKKPTKSNSLLWLGNPNNPDGKITPRQDIEYLCGHNPDTIFIVDEAYGELCDKFNSVINLVSEYRNLIVVHSLTKAFAIPGIRLGYMVGFEGTIEKIKSIKMPWSVNTIAIEAGNFILADFHRLLPDKKTMLYESKILQQKLANIHDPAGGHPLEVTPSECNYFLVRLKKGKAANLKQYLIHQHGLLIRDASNFRGLHESHFRVAIQRPEYNTLLVKAIINWINNCQ